MYTCSMNCSTAIITWIPISRNQAYEHLVKSKEYLDENTYFMYKVLYFDTFAKYYQAIGAYQQASDYIDTTLTMLKKDFTSDYAEQLLEKARIWKQAGQSGKAIPLYEQALAIKDSTATVLSNNQMAQIQSKYNIEKTELDQKRENNRIQLTYLIFIFVILILLFIFRHDSLWYGRHSNTRKTKSGKQQKTCGRPMK